jgi:hypothetical protein
MDRISRVDARLLAELWRQRYLALRTRTQATTTSRYNIQHLHTITLTNMTRAQQTISIALLLSSVGFASDIFVRTSNDP